MNQIAQRDDNFVGEIVPALWVELRKVRRSKTLWITALGFSLTTFIGGLFMFILKDPEQARRLGLLGAKAQILGGSADWPSFFSFVALMVSAGGVGVFGVIFVWLFGREFSDKTVYDFLSLPVSRVTIVAAKIITGAYWSVSLVLLAFVLTLGIGTILQLPGWSTIIAINGFRVLLITGLLTVILCIPFALVASVTRSYLPAVGCIFLAVVLGQIVGQLGYGEYFPWSIPALVSGATETLTGKAAAPLGLASYIIVGMVGIISLLALGAWWRYADQT